MFEDLKKQYEQDVENYENPWLLWEFKYFQSGWLKCSVLKGPLWSPDTEYRRLDPHTVQGLISKVKGHPHAELMAQYAEDAKDNPKPWKLWEFKTPHCLKWGTPVTHPVWSETNEYRRKPKTTNLYIYTRLAYNSLGGTDLYTAQFDNCNPKNLEHQVLVGNSVKWAEPEWNIREVILEEV